MASPKELGYQALYTPCDPAVFDFDSTQDITDGTEILGQPRAVEAVRVGVELQDHGYNIFALGPAGVGKRFLVEHFLNEQASQRPIPPDLCYINDLGNPKKPKLLELPAGTAIKLRQDINALVDAISSALPGAFETEEYHSRLHALEEEFRSRPAKNLDELRDTARSKGLTMFQTSLGVAFAPIRDGEVLAAEQFEKLSGSEQERIHKDIEALQEKVQTVLRQIPRWERDFRNKVRELNHEVASFAIGHFIDDLRESYRDLPGVLDYLSALQRDITEHARDLLQIHEAQASGAATSATLPDSVPARRYTINVMVDHSGLRGAPVVYEDHPTYENLVGRVEHLAQMGTLITDFNLIKAGALHRANGGYLVLDARKVLLMPFAWEALKRALHSRQIRIESLGQALSLISTVSLEPEPVPLNIKVVLIGDRLLYYLLCQYDPEFSELFKIAADFEDELERSPDNQRRYSRLIASLVRKYQLKPFDRSGVARVIEHAARLADDAERLSLRFGPVGDLLREASYIAEKEGRHVVTAADVQEAIDAQTFRSDRIRNRIRSEILRNTIYIDTEGTGTGQVNGLSVLQLGNFSFGRPSRITARVRPGKGEVIDIEREVELGGPLHSKGVLILSGLLGARYASNQPLALSATLVFEQSYSGVEGDSASSAELYALLSAIASVPIRQSLAVTGSVNQFGQVQPIGGVNEKIEGFFEVCSARGLTGEQGVLIPASNQKHLMLRRDVVDAVRNGQFHIYPVDTVDQGIEILTGIAAGERGEDGVYSAGTIGARVQERLADMARRQIAFAKAAEGKDQP